MHKDSRTLSPNHFRSSKTFTFPADTAFADLTLPLHRFILSILANVTTLLLTLEVKSHNRTPHNPPGTVRSCLSWTAHTRQFSGSWRRDSVLGSLMMTSGDIDIRWKRAEASGNDPRRKASGWEGKIRIRSYQHYLRRYISFCSAVCIISWCL